MITHFRTQGIIIKKSDRGEADQLFTIYAKDFGKLEILGKAIRKIKSKLRSGAELFYLSEIEFIQGKTYKTLTDTILIENFSELRKDLKRLATAFKISETLDNLVKGEEKDEKIWELLKDTFQKLNALEIRNWKLEILYDYFLWNLLSVLGYQPELYNCAICQGKLVPLRLYFSPKEGGIICSDCFKKTKSGKKIEPEVVKILRIILKKDWQTLSKLKIFSSAPGFFAKGEQVEIKYKKSLESISGSYLEEVLGGIK